MDAQTLRGLGIDRRSFLIRSGVAVGTAGLWSLAGSGVAPVAADTGALASATEQIFGALVGAVEANDGVIFDADDIAAAVAQFAATYALYDPASQTSFAAALAILEAAPAAGVFSTLDSATQRTFLTSWQPNAPASARGWANLELRQTQESF